MTAMDPSGSAAGKTRRGLSWLLLPLLIFAGIAALFAVALRSGDPSKLPSALIGKPAPAYKFTPLDGVAAPRGNGFDEKALLTAAPGTVTVVNYWASWCAPCVEEHPQLVEIGKLEGVTLAGVNMKDEPDNARRFLARWGNPFQLIGQDRSGRGAIEWGVYGTPETFILDASGAIRWKHVGPISKDQLERELKPRIEAARRIK